MSIKKTIYEWMELLFNNETLEWFNQPTSVRILPFPKNWAVKENYATIQRIKLWNIEGNLWLESETWGFENNQIQRSIIFLGKTKSIIKNPINLIQIYGDKEKEKLSQEFLIYSLKNKKDLWTCKGAKEIITQNLINHLQNISSKKPPPNKIRCTNSIPTEEEIFIIPEKSFETLHKLKSEKTRKNNNYQYLTEEIEGCVTSLNFGYTYNNGDITLYQEIQNPFHGITKKKKSSITLRIPKESFIPVKTIEILIAEEISWNEIHNRNEFNDLTHNILGNYIHNSNDFWKIKTFFSKNQPQHWSDQTGKANKENLTALIYSAACIVELNKNISNKLIRHHVQSGDFEALYNGGMLNALLFKNAWAWGWDNPITNYIEKTKNIKNELNSY